MKTWKSAVLLGALACFVSLPVFAEEIVYFTSGSRMVIQNHKVLDGMMHVDLGKGSSMAFPVTMVEKVTYGDKAVFDLSSYDGTANIATSSNRGSRGARTAFASADRSYHSYARNRSRRATGDGAAAAAKALDDLLLGRTAGGHAAPADFQRPLANHVNRAARQMTVAGDKRIFGRTAAAASRTPTGRSAQTATTPGGEKILFGEPQNQRKVLHGVEVYGMEENSAVRKAWIGQGGRRKESNYTQNTVVEGDD